MLVSKEVLISESPFFEALFRTDSDWSDAQSSNWKLPYSIEAIRFIVRYMYTRTADC